MAFNHPLASSSACCASSSCSQEMRDRNLVQERDVDHSPVGIDSVDHCCSADDSGRVDPCGQLTRDVPSFDEDPNEEKQNIKTAKGYCKLEKTRLKEVCCAAEDERYPSEEPKGCCEVGCSNREGSCGATCDGPPNNEEDLTGDDCCKDNTRNPTSCCDLGFLKQHDNEDGVCCDGKWSTNFYHYTTNSIH